MILNNQQDQAGLQSHEKQIQLKQNNFVIEPNVISFKNINLILMTDPENVKEKI